MKLFRLLCFVVCATACGSGSTPTGRALETTCMEAEQRLGHRVCVHAIEDRGTWEQIAFTAAAVDRARATTYLMPARDDARIPVVFVDASAFEMPEQSLHYQFLTESFPDLASISYEEYLELVLDPERREWFGGSLTEFVSPEREPIFGFTVAEMGTEADATIRCEQFRTVYATLSERVTLGTLAIVPGNALQRETLEGCDVPVHDPSLALDYEPYTRAKRCGRVRLYTASELVTATARADFGFDDILVTDEAPFDIETVIAGIVTGTRQGELSHLNVRSASRGTPNCYVKGAYELLAMWEGELVELECGAAGATIVAVTPDEAARCNEGLRPEPVAITPADLEWTALVPLLDLPTDTAAERDAATARFGSKGKNLAVLYQRIDAALQLEGFLIPVGYYDAFVRSAEWSVDLGSGPELLTFEETLERFLDDAELQSDGAARRERLAAIQGAMRRAACDPALVADISAQILATYAGDDGVMVRFRSSSNAEDALGFNGAGLYDSTSVCLADDTDADADGPSRCDPDQPSERGVCRGLTRVWASLWNMKAYEERTWFGIEHRDVAMGILVDTRTKGERANIVAFTGNPLLRGDRRYLINAQLGELDVVSAVPGVWPEKALLTIVDGHVEQIERARGSTELPEGEWVLDDARLQELGEQLAGIADVYPLDEEPPATARVMLDTEWKIRDDGQLVIKQIRPFMQ